MVLLLICLLLPAWTSRAIEIPQALLIEGWPSVNNGVDPEYEYNGVLQFAGETPEGGPYYAHPVHDGIIRMDRAVPGVGVGRWLAQRNGVIDFFQKTPTLRPDDPVPWEKNRRWY